MSVEYNVLGGLPDVQLDLDRSLVAKGATELKIIEGDIIVDRLDAGDLGISEALAKFMLGSTHASGRISRSRTAMADAFLREIESRFDEDNSLGQLNGNWNDVEDRRLDLLKYRDTRA